MEKLHVGQVVFVFIREEHSVLPVQVVEEVVHRRLTGEETSYFVRAAASEDAKIVPLNLKKNKVFNTINEARQFMIENATRAIDEICKEADDESKKFVQKEQAREQKVNGRSFEEEETPKIPGMSRITLPTGEKVNVIL